MTCRQTWHGSDSRRFWSNLKRVPPINVWTPMPSWYFSITFASAAIWLAISLVGQRIRTSIGGTRWILLLLVAFKTASIAGSCSYLIPYLEERTENIINQFTQTLRGLIYTKKAALLPVPVLALTKASFPVTSEIKTIFLFTMLTKEHFFYK